MKMKKKKGPLWDHIRKGKTFLPAPLAMDTKWQEVDRFKIIVPELFWISVVVHKHPDFDSISKVTDFVSIVNDETNWVHDGSFLRIRDYYQLSSTEFPKIRKKAEETGVFESLKPFLILINSFYPSCPLNNFLQDGETYSGEQMSESILAEAITALDDKYSKTATYTNATYYHAMVKLGKLRFVPGGPKPMDIKRVEGYPDSEESKSIASRLRATIITMNMGDEIKGIDTKKWPNEFWRQNLSYGKKEADEIPGIKIGDFNDKFVHHHLQVVGEYLSATKDYFETLVKEYNFDVFSKKDEIILGLLTRIYRLCVHVVSFIPNWSSDISESYLRMISDSYIHLKWFIEKGTDEDFKRFYEYGLGQQKLQSEHIRVYLEKQGVSEEEANDLNLSLRFIEKHKYKEFISVNVGSWNSKTTRDLAAECDCQEIYSLIYSPTSSTIHGMYDCLDRFYLTTDKNPFHGFAKLPYYWYKSPISLFAITNIVQLTDSAFGLIWSKIGLKNKIENHGEKYLGKIFDFTPEEDEELNKGEE